MKFEQDLVYVRLAVPDLEDFLLSKELFWPLPSAPRNIGVPGLDALSLGNLRLCMARLQAAQPSEEVAGLAAKIALVSGKWRSNWSKKAAREFGARTDQWRRSIEEVREHPGVYARDVRLRVILELLGQDILSGDHPAEFDLLAGLDLRLRGMGKPGAFLWDEALRSAFPETPYWFLYWTGGGTVHAG